MEIVRATTAPCAVRDGGFPSLDAVADPPGPPVLFGHFSVFNIPRRIDNPREGPPFIERIAPGAFSRSFAEDRRRIRLLFSHGLDPAIASKPLGKVLTLRDDGYGGYYEAALFDTAYVAELLPGLRAGQFGASFRGEVSRQRVDRRPARSDWNLERLPERTITEVRLFEFGPVLWGAYPDATATLRSLEP